MLFQSLYVRAQQKCLTGCSNNEECDPFTDKCLADEVCSRFEIQRVLKNSDDIVVENLVAFGCMGKDQCEANKDKINPNLIAYAETMINSMGFNQVEGMKFACCNFGSTCNSNDIAEMKVEQEKFEKGDQGGAADSSANKASSKVYFVFLIAFCSFVF